MKKTILALAVLGAFASAASAQSSVTLSGGIDLGVAQDFVGGVSNKVVQTAGTSARSNLTFSGREDLGGGMYAQFLLNHRFRPGTGQVNPGGNNAGATPLQFWRNSWVQLGGGFGAVRLGRFLDPLQEHNGNFDAFGTDTVGSVHTGGLKASVRVNDAVEYRSPTMSGFQVLGYIASADNQGQAPIKNRNSGGALSYMGGPIYVAVAFDKNADSIKTTGLYGSYKWGSSTVMGQYETSDKAVGGPAANKKPKAISISAKIPFGATDFKVGYRKNTGEPANGTGDRKKFGIGADYNLSKRTQLYADIGKVSGGNANDEEKKTRYDLGVYHKF